MRPSTMSSTERLGPLRDHLAGGRHHGPAADEPGTCRLYRHGSGGVKDGRSTRGGPRAAAVVSLFPLPAGRSATRFPSPPHAILTTTLPHHVPADPDDEAAYRAGLLRRCGAPAAAIAEVERVRGGAAGLAPPVEVDVRLEGEAGDVPGARGWRFVWTPGHTAGHLSLHRPADGVLIAGDAVLPRITPTLGVNRQRTDPVGDYLDALARLEALAPSRVLPGHGDPPPDAQARIQELRAAAEAESAAVGAVLDGAPATAWQVVERRYRDREMPVSTRMLALRETLAHLDRLVAAGRAVETQPEENGAAGFRRCP
jgi:glyoxylase-like metal-dependent hydrolase (beta-lactamase superfamily II)